jgi:hypothetical protein
MPGGSEKPTLLAFLKHLSFLTARSNFEVWSGESHVHVIAALQICIGITLAEGSAGEY